MRNLIFIFLFFITFNVFAQEDKEIWYTWIDTKVQIDGEQVRLVSNELMELTCCVSSAKYRKFTSKTTQWLEKELKVSIGEESPFAKTRNKDLAKKILGEALEKAEGNSGIRVLNYHEKCK